MAKDGARSVVASPTEGMASLGWSSCGGKTWRVACQVVSLLISENFHGSIGSRLLMESEKLAIRLD
jgi:hypothetical protein